MQKPKPNFKIDEIILVLIVAILAMAVSTYDKANKPSAIEAEKITAMILDDHAVSFATNRIIDENKLREFQKMDYASLKNTLNVKNDFCIYVEDENGNVIFSKGSSKFNEDGLVCRE